jgi:hypothetical protein
MGSRMNSFRFVLIGVAATVGSVWGHSRLVAASAAPTPDRACLSPTNPSVRPQAGFTALTAPASDLRCYGFPTRPTDDLALQQWIHVMTRSLHYVAPVVTTVPHFGPMKAVRSQPSSRHRTWTAVAHLYTMQSGQWRPATSVASLGRLREVLTVHGEGLAGSRLTATMSLVHLSWQETKRGLQALLVPPRIVATMRHTGTSQAGAVFTVDVRIPTLLPVYWSVIRFRVTAGLPTTGVSTGIMVGLPAQQTTANTLTVAGAHQFCSARPKLPYLRYAVYLHGYYVPVVNGGDGPPGGIVFDRPYRAAAPLSSTRAYADSIRAGGFVTSRRTGWGTSPGFLACGNGRAIGFGA